MARPVAAGQSATVSAPSKPPASNIWITIALLSLGTFATGTDAFIATGVLPRLSADLHITQGAAGQLVTIFAWVYGIGSPILMTVTARLSRRFLLSSAILVFGLSNFAVLFMNDFAGMAVVRVVAAASAATYVPAAAVTAAMLAPPHQRGRALALVIGGSSLATALGVPVGIWISDAFDSWRAAFVFVGVLSVVAFMAIVLVLPRVPTLPPVSLRNRVKALRRPRVLGVLLVTLLAMTGGFTVFTYLAPIMSRVAPQGSGKLEWLVFTFGVASLLGSWLAGHGSDKWGSHRVVGVGLVILVANFIFFDFAVRSLVGAFVTMAIWGVAAWGFLPAQQHRLVQLSPTEPNVVISLNSSALYVGIALGSSLGGSLVGHFSVGTLRWFAAALDLAALLLSLIVSGRSAANQESEVPS